MEPESAERLKQLYDRFNARDIEAALGMLHRDVEWANGVEGGHVHGHDKMVRHVFKFDGGLIRRFDIG